MQTLGSLLRSTLRVGFRRASLDRIQLGPATLPLALAAAVAGLVFVLKVAANLHTAQTAVAVFAFIGLLAPVFAFCTRYLPRRRLVALLVVLCWLFAMGAVLAGCLAWIAAPAGPLQTVRPDPGRWVAAAGLLPLLAGCGQALATALKQPLLAGVAWCLGFAALVYGLYRLLEGQLALVFA